MTTPDQDGVDELGRALGIEQEADEECGPRGRSCSEYHETVNRKESAMPAPAVREIGDVTVALKP